MNILVLLIVLPQVFFPRILKTEPPTAYATSPKREWYEFHYLLCMAAEAGQVSSMKYILTLKVFFRRNSSQCIDRSKKTAPCQKKNRTGKRTRLQYQFARPLSGIDRIGM